MKEPTEEQIRKEERNLICKEIEGIEKSNPYKDLGGAGTGFSVACKTILEALKGGEE